MFSSLKPRPPGKVASLSQAAAPHAATSMTSRSSSLPLLLFASCICAGSCSAFAVGRSCDRANINLGRKPRSSSSLTKRCFTFLANGEARAECRKSIAICPFQGEERGGNDGISQWSRRRVRMLANQSDNEEEPMQIFGLGDDTLPDKTWEDIEAGAPSELSIMKELLGINIFTYILGAACVFFLSMNAILGPGWLGQVAGIQGTGSFTEVSDALPGNIDLNNPENLLF